MIIAEPEQGDAENRLLQIDIGRDDLPNAHRSFVAQFGRAPGSHVHAVRDNDAELRAASLAAIAALPSIHARFERGLASGDVLLVKAPIPPTGGREYVWIRVDSWHGSTIRGLLTNEPEHTPGMHLGDAVVVDEATVFDYALHHRDGGVESGGTDAILARRRE